jgi:plasmid stabilization system protein ParE
MPLILRPSAEAEFDAAFDYYEGRRSGLGAEFAENVQETFDRIIANPELYAIIKSDARRALVARFPYGIFYRVRASHIDVIAVFHHKRNPRIWERRL